MPLWNNWNLFSTRSMKRLWSTLFDMVLVTSMKLLTALISLLLSISSRLAQSRYFLFHGISVGRLNLLHNLSLSWEPNFMKVESIDTLTTQLARSFKCLEKLVELVKKRSAEAFSWYLQ